jgi:DNA-binding transcriptional LysR family regulator
MHNVTFQDLTLRSLRIFETAGSTRSLTRTAEIMDLTQSAVSQQLRTLEEEVGKRLFDTQARPIELTDAGRELLRHARIILSQIKVAADALNSMNGQLRGQLHIGIVSPANYFMPYLVTAFHDQFPEVRIRLTVGKRDQLLVMLAERRVDLLVSGFPPAQTEVDVVPFARHPHYMVAHPGHPLARQNNIGWEMLRDERFIFREQGAETRKFLEHLLEVQRLQVNADLEMHGNETIKHAVMSGMGISFLSAHVFQHELRAGQLAVLDIVDLPKWLDWCIVSRIEQTVPMLHKAFRDFVIAQGDRFAACDFVPGSAATNATASLDAIQV